MREDMSNADFLTVDFLVVGAGILGLASAAELSALGRVALVEQEAHPCHHSSGRSAAIFVRSYGSPEVQALTREAEQAFAEAEAEGRFAALGVPKGLLVVAPRGSGGSGAAPFRVAISAAEAARLNPILDPDRLEAAWWEDSARDIDVHAMQTGYLATLRRNGGRLFTDHPVLRASWQGGRWLVQAGGTTIQADRVVNAAGAWADPVGALFGAAPLGLVPKRRSAAIIDPPAGIAAAGLPMVVDVDETVYFKPDAGRLMLSPADATPVEPHDAWADDMDIALAVDRYERLTGRQVQRVHHMWAGLRTFLPDENPMIGADAVVPGFYWLAGFGGFGVQTAPAAARRIAGLMEGIPATQTEAV